MLAQEIEEMVDLDSFHGHCMEDIVLDCYKDGEPTEQVDENCDLERQMQHSLFGSTQN
jgi:hypothetical protein